jgi:hypothetical protein
MACGILLHAGMVLAMALVVCWSHGGSARFMHFAIVILWSWCICMQGLSLAGQLWASSIS